MTAPDKPERTPLSSREYYTIREIFGLISCLERGLGNIERRAKKQPGVWRDLKLISAKAQSAVTALLRTVPAEKLKMIMGELESTEVTVDVVRKTTVPKPEKEAYTYVPEAALETLTMGVIEWHCAFCEKSRKESKKCKWRRAIEATYPYELRDNSKEYCVFSSFAPDDDTAREDVLTDEPESE